MPLFARRARSHAGVLISRAARMFRVNDMRLIVATNTSSGTMARMELSQRLDLAKFGFDTPGDESDTQDIARDGDAFAQLCALLVKIGVVEDAQEISADDTLDSLDADSLTQIEFVVRAEDHFGVRINEELFASWDTLGDMAEYLAP